MAIAAASLPRPLEGVLQPRIAPPVPAISLMDGWKAAADELGITPMPWQLLTARYLNARGDKLWLYREVAIVVGRQNGKTEILKPFVKQRLRMGRRMLHTAQNREIPRASFLELAAHMYSDPSVKSIREANGQETIEVHAEGCNRRKRCGCKGGKYTLVAPRPGVRGHGVDDVILDEVREQRSFELIAAIKPTLTASPDAQIVYLSNAGDDGSLVLNDLKRRSENGSPRLAYLEWSASPERSIDDRQGWAEANPALGITITLETLEADYESMPAPDFETEHLCRWQASMQPKLVSEADWMKCRGEVSTPEKPMAAFSMSPDGKRASSAMAWRMADGRVALVELLEAEGQPIDVDRLGPDLKKLMVKNRVRKTGYASWTDAPLARYMPNADTLDGKEFATACGDFVRLVQSGRLVWDGAQHITEDLMWTSRKPHDSGAWTAVPASPERSVTAVLAAIRAVSLAGLPKPPLPRIG